MEKLIIIIFTLLSMPSMASYSSHKQVALDTIRNVEVGDQCPNITIKNITHSDKTEITLSDYKGKLLILDFWATWCGPCVVTLPKNNSLQQEFGNRIQFLLISDESKKTIDDYFLKAKKINGADIKLPSVFADDQLRRYFPHIYIPHYVWINETGKVIGITESDQVTSDNIRKILSGRLVQFSLKEDRNNIDQSLPFFNETITKPLFVHEDIYGPNSIKYRSAITAFINDISSGTGFYTGRIIAKRASIVGMLRSSYSYSFSDKMQPIYQNQVILEVKDPVKYLFPKDSTLTKSWTMKNTFVYDLIFPDYYKGMSVSVGPDSIRKYACEVMRKDIEAFSGLHSRLEKRSVKCLVLICINSDSIFSKQNFGSSRQFPGNFGGVFNYPTMDLLVRSLKHAFQHLGPFIDETNYSGKVNIKIEAPLSDLAAVNKELTKFGLKLIEESKTIDMIVITDKK